MDEPRPPSRAARVARGCCLGAAIVVPIYCCGVAALVGNSLEPGPPLPGNGARIQVGMTPESVVRLMGRPDHGRRERQEYAGQPVRSTWIYDAGVQVDFEDRRVSWVGEVAGY